MVLANQNPALAAIIPVLLGFGGLLTICVLTGREGSVDGRWTGCSAFVANYMRTASSHTTICLLREGSVGLLGVLDLLMRTRRSTRPCYNCFDYTA